MKYLNETTTVSCYSLYMSSDGTLQLSNQRMCATDGSHFMSLILAAIKSVSTLFQRPPGSSLHLHAIASKSLPVWFVWIPLDVLMQVARGVDFLTKFHTSLEVKLLQ